MSSESKEKEKKEFVAPKDSKEILDRIQTLTFKERLQFAADIGRKAENADELIKQLRDVSTSHFIIYIPFSPFCYGFIFDQRITMPQPRGYHFWIKILAQNC